MSETTERGCVKFFDASSFLVNYLLLERAEAEGVVQVCGVHECQLLYVLFERYVLLFCFDVYHFVKIFNVYWLMVVGNWILFSLLAFQAPPPRRIICSAEHFFRKCLVVPD